MPICDEADCELEAAALCLSCIVFLCLDHCGGDGSDCPECGGEMKEL